MNTTNNSTCSYHFESLSHTTPTDLVDVPQQDPNKCSYSAAEGENSRCLFHASQQDFPPDVIADEFLSRVNSTSQPANFAGGNFGNLDLSGEVLETPNGRPIDLRGALIDGTLDLTETKVKVPLLLGNATIVQRLEADNAQFHAPVDLAGITVDRGVHLHNTTFKAGLAANDIEGGFVDARAVSIHGPAIFDNAEFSANVHFARSQFTEQVSFVNSYFDKLADFTMVEVQGDASFNQIKVGGETRFTAAKVGRNCEFSGCELTGEADFAHSLVEGNFDMSESICSDKVDLGDFRCHGSEASLNNTTFEAYTTFAFSEFPTATVSLVNVSFKAEAWFVHAVFGKSVDFSESRFEGLTHLRDAEFCGDLMIHDCDFENQGFIHGSVINGNCIATDSNFVHFQFGATADGDVDFSRCRFDESAIFSRSEVGGDAIFEDTSFAGNPDFSESTFKGQTSFENTEFLVEPTFKNTRFAIEPDFETASCPKTSQRNLSDRRRMSMVVARPEKLCHRGMTLPLDAVTRENITVPLTAKPLLEPSEDLSRRVALALDNIEHPEWCTLFNDSIELARTAVAELENESDTVLVFGLSINKGISDVASFLDKATLLGVFEFQQAESQFRFGHLHSDMGNIEDTDIAITVGADDDAFESGITVGSTQEFRKAIMRRQIHQLALLEQNKMTTIVEEYIPMIVASAHAKL